MPAPNQTNNRLNGVTVTSRPGPRTRDAMVAAAAAMALADGRAEPVEHRGLLTFLRRNKMLLVLGRSEMTARYSAEVARVTERRDNAVLSPQQTNDLDGWQEMADKLRPLGGMEAARLVIAAAASVAVADGVVHPGEAALLRSLNDALGLGHAPMGATA